MSILSIPSAQSFRNELLNASPARVLTTPGGFAVEVESGKDKVEEEFKTQLIFLCVKILPLGKIGILHYIVKFLYCLAPRKLMPCYSLR